MSEYSVAFKDGRRLVARGNSPQEVMDNMFPDREFAKVDASNADVMITLRNGQRRISSYFKLKGMKTSPSRIDRVFVVTACREPYSDDVGGGVELAGIFSSSEKAQKAKALVNDWLKKEGYDEGEVFVEPKTIDDFNWYEINTVL